MTLRPPPDGYELVTEEMCRSEGVTEWQADWLFHVAWGLGWANTEDRTGAKVDSTDYVLMARGFFARPVKALPPGQILF